MVRLFGCMVVALVALVALAGPPSAGAAGSPDVAALQVALRANGLYAGTVDGVRGAGTRNAVARFQSRQGLVADGVAGATTRRALGRRGRPSIGSRTIRRGDSGWDVAALQFSLAWRGFPSARIDGGFGSHLEAALERFQSWSGLPADGVAGARTLQALRRPVPRSPIWLVAPIRAAITDGFGPRGNSFHPGADYPAPAGTPVTAAGGGRVVFAGWDSGGYGNLVVVEHPAGVRSMYGHLSRIRVSTDRQVVAGTRIGDVGATGVATGPHLHFELRLRGASIDPLTALR